MDWPAPSSSVPFRAGTAGRLQSAAHRKAKIPQESPAGTRRCLRGVPAARGGGNRGPQGTLAGCDGPWGAGDVAAPRRLLHSVPPDLCCTPPYPGWGDAGPPPRRSGLAHGAQDLLLSPGDRDALPPQGPCATGTLTASPSLILHPGKLRQGRSGHGAEPLSIHTGSPDWCSRGLGDPSVPTSTTGTTTQHGLSSVRCRPRTAETILYMESSKCCLLHSRRDARVIFGNAESPTTNAGAGLVAFLITARWAPCGTAAVHPHPRPHPIPIPSGPALLGARGRAGVRGRTPQGGWGAGQPLPRPLPETAGQATPAP